jgi:hypothetical protein
MAVALIALFVAMGGIGYAAAKVGSRDIKVNAVKSRHIANGAVTKRAIHKGAVVGVQIANRTVTGGKLANNSVRASKLGATVDGLNSLNVPANDAATTTVSCPAGGQAISGGFSTPQNGQIRVTRMRRSGDSAWSFGFRNTSGTPRVVDARVTCLAG